MFFLTLPLFDFFLIRGKKDVQERTKACDYAQNAGNCRGETLFLK